MRKKLLTFLLAITASAGTLFAESGTCGDNLTWDLTDGVLTISGTGPMTDYTYDTYAPWYNYKSSITSVFIGDGLTSIGDYAFSDCSNMASITIPNSVTSIGDCAFQGCSGLTSVAIPNNITSIGGDAFLGCENLTSVYITDLTAWCNIVFDNANANPLFYTHNLYLKGNLVSGLIISDNITNIGNYAFIGSGLTSVTIGNSVTSIGERAFYGCRALTSVTIGNSVTSIGERAFFYCTGLTSVTIPNSVTYIGIRAFEDCTGLTSVTIPNSVTSIGDDAFADCTGLTSVVWDAKDCSTSGGFGSQVTSFVFGNEVETIPAACCSGMNITSITIPNSVTSIGDYAFADCTGLTSVTIGNSVTSIGDYAFYYCTGLTSVEIPNSVTSIGWGAFYYVPNIVYSGSATGAPWGAKSINGYVDGFWVYSDNTKTTLLACSSIAQGEIVIPNSVTSIGHDAFAGCSSWTSVMIPNSVTSIGNSAFYNILNIVYSGSAAGAPWGARIINGYVDGYLAYSDNTKTTLLVCSSAAQGAIAIPNSVINIGDDAFHSCKGLTSVTIPNSVTNIGDFAFHNCEGLTSVTIGNSVTNIGIQAFESCLNLKSVTIGNSITNIREKTFQYCDSITQVIWNAKNCTGYSFGNQVESFIFGEKVEAIPKNICSGMYKLTSVTIPNSVTSIGNSAFYGCSGLTSVIIGNSVTSIGNSAFYGCSGLTSVTIPGSVTSIGTSAFNMCYNLKSIYPLPITPPAIESSTFKNINNEARVYLTFGTGQWGAYAQAMYWKELLYPFMTQYQYIGATSYKVTFDVEDIILQSIGIEGGEQQPGNVLEYIGLEPNSEYKDIPVVLTANTGETETVNVSFTTTALELTTKPSKPVSSTTAILLAETNMSDVEVSCGFEYKRNDAPADMDGTKVYCPVASGQMAGRLKNLKDDVYYKYRAFYQSAAGNMYYGDWQYIFTGDVAVEFDPILYTYGATVVRENEATISGYALAGSEDFTEQGFEYWAESRANNGANAPHRMPAALNEHFFVQASGIALRATLNNLDAGTVYRYRVYGKVGDQYYYGSEQTFTTTGTYTPPTYTITFANWDGATLQSSQVEEGTLPEYTGATPIRPDDEQYTYVFDGWTPAIVVATADATYTATYQSEPKSQGIEDIQGDDVQCTKVLRDGTIYILRGDKTYTLTGQEVK